MTYGEIMARALAQATDTPLHVWRTSIKKVIRDIERDGREHNLDQDVPASEAHELLEQLKTEAPGIRAWLLKTALGAV